ncbi:TetR/AcrR family transcriptional regulator [Nakamurella flava]|uniref:TetR/AcrR family transcriptional regulator n=1 Tax=Nakamurella flava TaxID=2576308 RepID=A0A4U6QJC3_9ACTN|nr:TetR/AcrR family transcriptional regulator [Nakamurella flava]TKV60182.1 TetR/AcrR family transcriptional regulator [Nakamurella flava]
MVDAVKGSGARRGYRSAQRAEQAAATRREVLAAARALFTTNGYRATTIGDIAGGAGVAVDTVYAAVGRKPVILRELVETAISGTDRAVPPEEREYVVAVRRAVRAHEKLRLYGQAISAVQQRLGPIFLALRDAGVDDPACAEVWSTIAARRAANMRVLAGELRSTGELRDDLTDEAVADVLWSMNAAEYWDLLVRQRGWSPDEFGRWLGDAWARLLLR